MASTQASRDIVKLNARHKIGLKLANVLPFSWSWKLLKIPSSSVLAGTCGRVVREVKEDLSPLIPRCQGAHGEIVGSDVFAFPHGYSTHWGANLTSRGELIADLSRQGYGREKAHFSFGKPRVKKARRIRGSVATLTIEHRGNYFHFLTDAISRLQLIQNLKRPPDYIYVQSDHKYQAEILSRLGYKTHQIIDSSRHPYIEADELLVPGYVSNLGLLTRNSILYLRSKLKSGLSRPPASRCRIVFISRRDSPKRKLLNEDKLLDQLAPFQVEAVVLSERSVEQNIELFETADVVIGQWGAGMADLIFARQELFVVLLTPPVWSDIVPDLIKPFGLKYCNILMSTFPREADPYAPSTWYLTDEEIQSIVEAVSSFKKSAPAPADEGRRLSI